MSLGTRPVIVACEDEPHSRPYLAALIAVGVPAERLRLLVPTGRTDLAALGAEMTTAAAGAAGVVLCGGPDVDPTRYGEAIRPDCDVEVVPELDALDFGLLTGAREAATPVLAICRGMQVANVFMGGTLWQDLPSQRPTAIAHAIKQPKDAVAHVVAVSGEIDHPLARLLGEAAPDLPVNSRHHQAIKDLGEGLLAIAESPDGLVEALATADDDAAGRPRWWLWGVEWHPENLLAHPAHRALFEHFASRLGVTPTPTVRVERSGRVATLWLDRPPLNILDLATIEALDARLAALSADPSLQLLIVRSASARAFSAGVAVEDHTRERVGPTLRAFHRALRRLWQLEAVTVAVVDGTCLGGGMELAAVCDVILASDRSRFGQPEIKLGCYPPVAAALYPRLLGQGATVELLVSGRLFDAAEAARLGFVRHLVPASEVESRLATLTEELSAVSTPVARLAKRAIRRADAGAFEAALAEAERLYLTELVELTDLDEGLTAFLDKRPPVWRHA